MSDICLILYVIRYLILSVTFSVLIFLSILAEFRTVQINRYFLELWRGDWKLKTIKCRLIWYDIDRVRFSDTLGPFFTRSTQSLLYYEIRVTMRNLILWTFTVKTELFEPRFSWNYFLNFIWGQFYFLL